jgi:glycosyltransferase involved in cell wall biosynthesis
MNIAFVYAQGRIDRYNKTLQGSAATEFFYGALEMELRGHNISLYELGNGAKKKYWYKIAELFYRLRILPTRTNGQIMSELYDMYPHLNKQDVIVATTTAAAFGLAILKLLGLLKSPIVAIHCGIVNYQLFWWRKKINSIALNSMWTQLFGEGELSEVIRFYRVSASRVEVNQFGVDASFWYPGNVDGDYILAVGNDKRRDYELLLKAAARIKEKVIIVTRQKINVDIPANVEIFKGGWHEESLTDEKLRMLYQNSRMVIVPLVNSPQPSGQSVCLQAMSCGKPVILTQTDGLWSSEMMRDGENVVFIPPADQDAMLDAISHLYNDLDLANEIGNNARETVCHEGNIVGFSERLEALCQLAMAAKNEKKKKSAI